MKSIGIDIGTYSIKVAEIEETTSLYKVNSIQVIPLSISPNDDQKIEVIEILRTISEHYKNQTVTFVLGVPQKYVSIHTLTFPFKERHKIIKSLAFELEESVPFSSAETIFDAKISGYKGNLTQVLATSVPKKYISDLISLTSDGNIDLKILSVEGLAFSNLFEKWSVAPGELNEDIRFPDDDEPSDEESLKFTSDAKVILDIGYSSSLILIVKDDRLIDIRNIDWGGKDLAQMISTEYKMHFSEALRTLESKSYLLLSDDDASEDQLRFSNTLKSSIDLLIHEIQLALLEVKSDFRLNYTDLLLMGGVSQLKNIGAYLTQNLDLPTNRLYHFKLHPRIAHQFTESEELVSAIATGLAIEGLRKPRNPAINLLKDEFQKKSVFIEQFWSKWSYLSYILIASFALFTAYSCGRDIVSQDNLSLADNTLRKQAAKILPNKKDSRSPTKIKNYIRKQNSLLKQQTQAKKINLLNSPLDLLKDLTQKLPKKSQLKMNISEFRTSENILYLKGEYTPRSAIKLLEGALKSLSSDNKVKALPKRSKAKSGFTSFAYQIKVKRLRED